MKRKIAILISILLFLLTINTGYCNDNEDSGFIEKTAEGIINDQINNLDLNELLKQIQDVNSSSGEYLPKINFKEFLTALIKGEKILDSGEILNGMLKMIFSEVRNNISILAKLLILSIICGVLMNLRNAFNNDSISEVAYLACYIVIMSIVIKSCLTGIRIGKEAIDQMVSFMQALFPTMMILLAAMGGITSSAIFQPIILGTMTTVSVIIKEIIIPLIYFSSIIGLINNISNKVQISKLAQLMRQVSVVIIGVCFTIFMGILSIQGMTAANVDGVTIRTAKFAIDSFIPIVGGYLSEAVDTVIGCSMLLKNAIGVVGLITLFIICIIPCIKIMSLIIIYKFTAALIQPIADKKLVESISEISKAFVLVLAAVISVALMFFITITIIITAGKMTIMLR
ncbi:stage III sporulation protein AE [Abyssisolibacter fermentans]|uniref:stage III sporulation protein AE n=1 Tax=Abyssisolibacter fermentans TaxID=1766203 RepID=UPI000831F4D3|nr:stage III sporulation protein AE [Abyssisolibacter fermentans]